IGRSMESTSLCGHGQLGFGPVRSALQHFEEDFRIHMEERRCPTGSCLAPFTAPRNTRPYAFEHTASPEHTAARAESVRKSGTGS
ncbi:MAG: hypothetical protein L0177_12060, partial [Chloroflexi bacterium]|nr:hypothetical protein [Chloroflexota bacterium]